MTRPAEPPFDLRGLDHVVLRSPDARALVAFYTGHLGCRTERVLEELGLWQLRAGAALLDIVDCNAPLGRAGGAPPAAGGRNMDHLCLRIEPFDGEALIAWLDAADIPHGDVERRYGAEGQGPSIYLSDPDGNQVELKGPPDRT